MSTNEWYANIISCLHMHNNQCIISHSSITMLLFVIVFMDFLSFSVLIPFHRVAKYVLPFGITGLNEKGGKKEKKKIKHESHTSKPNMQTQMRTDTHIRIQSYMPVFGSSCFWVVKTGTMTTRRPGKRNLTWITAWKYRHLNERNAGYRFPHKQEDLLAFPLRTCHVRRK